MPNKPGLQITPHTCADNFYSIASGAPSSMALLQNLVPTIDSIDEWVPRPGATMYSVSNTFTPGFISCMCVVGNRIYGLISSTLTANHDQPFCYDLLGGAFVSIAGITGANVPLSPPATGGWTPPHAELVGTKIVLTSSGYSGTGTNFFGMIEAANPAALSYATYNMNVGTGGTTLPSVPIWCTNFNGRAYFLCNPQNSIPAAIFSGALTPDKFFNGTTAPYNNTLQFPGNLPLTCGGTLAFFNQLGGQVQALIVFQGAANMFQVTGDPAFSISISTTAGTPTTIVNPAAEGALQINSLNIATGTLAPNTVCQSPMGLFFVAPDGLRIIDFQAKVSPPIGYAGAGVALPFYAASIPSRMCAACNATTIRISTINSALINTPQQEWCYDLVRQVWFGPHTFPVSLIVFYSQAFVASQIGLTGLWSTGLVPTSASSYVENGAAYQCILQSGFFPDRHGMEELSCTRAVFYQAYGAGSTTYTITVLDVNGNVLLGSLVTKSFSAAVTNWGQFAWGVNVWLGSASAMSAAQIPFEQPLVFDRCAFQINVQAAAGVRLGNILMDIDEESYTVYPT